MAAVQAGDGQPLAQGSATSPVVLPVHPGSAEKERPRFAMPGLPAEDSATSAPWRAPVQTPEDGFPPDANEESQETKEFSFGTTAPADLPPVPEKPPPSPSPQRTPMLASLEAQEKPGSAPNFPAEDSDEDHGFTFGTTNPLALPVFAEAGPGPRAAVASQVPGLALAAGPVEAPEATTSAPKAPRPATPPPNALSPPQPRCPPPEHVSPRRRSSQGSEEPRPHTAEGATLVRMAAVPQRPSTAGDAKGRSPPRRRSTLGSIGEGVTPIPASPAFAAPTSPATPAVQVPAYSSPAGSMPWMPAAASPGMMMQFSTSSDFCHSHACAPQAAFRGAVQHPNAIPGTPLAAEAQQQYMSPPYGQAGAAYYGSANPYDMASYIDEAGNYVEPSDPCYSQKFTQGGCDIWPEDTDVYMDPPMSPASQQLIVLNCDKTHLVWAVVGGVGMAVIFGTVFLIVHLAGD